MKKLFGKTTKTTTTTTTVKPRTVGTDIKTNIAFGVLFASTAFMGAAAYKGIEWCSDKGIKWLSDKIGKMKNHELLENEEDEISGFEFEDEDFEKEYKETEEYIERVHEEVKEGIDGMKMETIHETIEKEETTVPEEGTEE